ncbi:dihydroxyacetone kinase subunit DhaL [Streptomyces sp. NPDC035033]|uniref:dihydroxyacetone kinase subunit DhaL n=1 Tax=Streptomyces sp. NPDC035033 TaxID=3155368 RepID=UPI0033E569D1
MDVLQTHEWIRAIAAVVARNEKELCNLDAAIGDGDHGTNLKRGFDAALAALDAPDTASAAAPDSVGGVLVATGTTLISSVGGASGPLFGSAFRGMGRALGTDAEVTAGQFAAALSAGLGEVQRFGAAVPGDKTMVDALLPAVTAFRESAAGNGSFAAAARAAAEAAEAGARACVALQARKGRASYLGLRSIGHPDPGATSTAFVFAALADTVEPA